MDLPLISHPTRAENTVTYADDQLTQIGDLRLDAHNRVVAERATRLFDGDDQTEAYIQAAAALHDFGKATPQFQAYVRPDENADYPDGETAHARLGALATWYVLGDLDASEKDRLACTLAIARHHQALPNADQYTAETLARAFKRQDGAIRAQLEKIDNQWPGAAEELLEQAGWSNADWSRFHSWAASGEVSAELRNTSTESILGGYKLDPTALPAKLYDRTVRYWSAITLADKSHAMDIPEDRVFELDALDRETIEEYIAGIRNDPPENDLEARLNDERERARRQTVCGVHEWLETVESGSNIATITLPTGLGKTFTGLSAAFEARDNLAETGEQSTTRPIVYALPYTSIIEQTRAIFEDPDLWGADPQQSALTVHHYLSQTVVHHDQYEAADTSETDKEKTAELLGEAWRDGTILTTFVQLFESLTGPTNRQGLKLSALRESIVILDEPQALPKDWWDGIARLLKLLTEEYNTQVIAMTATQPSLVRNMETTSLLAAGKDHNPTQCEHCRAGPTYDTSLPAASKSTYFEAAERVRYSIDKTALSRQLGVEETHVGYKMAADRILKATEKAGSTLAVCNTIGSSRELTDTVREREDVIHLGRFVEDILQNEQISAAHSGVTAEKVAETLIQQYQTRESVSSDEPKTALLTLNSRYRPYDREILIELADRLSTSSIPFVLVSTQAIEAGVDLSFRTVFRDIAPIDSIVQAAGRCNRSYEWGEGGGRVVIWMLSDPEEDVPESPSKKPPAYYVYEKGATDAGIPGHLKLISTVLGDLPDCEDLSEVAVADDAVATYFDELDRKSLCTSDLRTAIDNAQGEWLGWQSLIGGVQTLDVLVGVTTSDYQEIETISEQVQNEIPEGYQRLEDAAGIRVSLPKTTVEDIPQLNRIDKRQRDSDGVQVFEFLGGSGLEYDLTKGGLAPSEDPFSDRFTM